MVVIPSSSATCAAGHSSTSRKISTARCRADRYCSAATNASRIPARDTATAAGSSPAPASPPGNGCSHGTSGAAASAASGSCAGPPSPDGSGRRPRRSIAVRHAFVAIRYSQVRTDDRPWNPSKDRHARRYVSCTRSSASSAEPSIR